MVTKLIAMKLHELNAQNLKKNLESKKKNALNTESCLEKQGRTKAEKRTNKDRWKEGQQKSGKKVRC